MSNRDRKNADGAKQLDVAPPSPRTRLIVSIAVAAHFSALLLALGCNFGRSLLQGEMMSWLSPYLVTTHQAYGSVALELTHNEPFDRDLQVEGRLSGKPWQPLAEAASLDVNGTRGWRELSRSLRIVIEDDPETELLTEVAGRITRRAAAQRSGELESIRFVEPAVLSFDEDAALAAGQGPLLGEASGPTVVFEASIVRDGEFVAGLLPNKEAYRESQAIEGEVPK